MTRKLIEQLLEVLSVATTPLAKDRQEVLDAITAAREYLAQPEQSGPVAWLYVGKGDAQDHVLLSPPESMPSLNSKSVKVVPLFTRSTTLADDYEFMSKVLAQPEQSEPVNQMLLKSAKYVVDVDDDYTKNAPEHRCYVPEAFSDSIEKLRTALATAEQAKPEKSEPVATIEISVRGSTTTIDNHFSDAVRDWPVGEYKLYAAPVPQGDPGFWLSSNNINSLVIGSLKDLIRRAKWCSICNIDLRDNGKNVRFEADWVKYMEWRDIAPAEQTPQPNAPEQSEPDWKKPLEYVPPLVEWAQEQTAPPSQVQPLRELTERQLRDLWIDCNQDMFAFAKAILVAARKAT